jgi:hypothetical protein
MRVSRSLCGCARFGLGRARLCASAGVWLSPAFLGGGGSFVFLTPLVGLGCALPVGWCRGLGFVVGPVRGTILVRVLVRLRVRLCR